MLENLKEFFLSFQKVIHFLRNAYSGDQHKLCFWFQFHRYLQIFTHLTHFMFQSESPKKKIYSVRIKITHNFATICNITSSKS